MEDKQFAKELYKNLKSIEIQDKKELALYVHIPFCEKKCNYCNFVSFCGLTEKIDDYIKALGNELILRKQENCVLKTIYLGGGTPSLLNSEQIQKIFAVIKYNYEIKEDAEITIEVNPNSVTQEKIDIYKKVGINRISVGIQSLNDKKLKFLGRLHNKKQAINTLEMIKANGFENISCDLIINLPNQSTFEIKSHIKKIKKYAKHLSIYGLSIEENTPFYKMQKNGQLKLPNEVKSEKQYKKIVNYLKKLGFYRYEVSNFAIMGYESKHNNTYWAMQDYLGIGVASHSFLDGVRYANTENLVEYIERIRGNKLSLTQEQISKENLIEETIMLGLRLSSGLDLDMLKSKYDLDLFKLKEKEILILKNLDLIRISENKIKVTDKGFTVLNQIILKLI